MKDHKVAVVSFINKEEGNLIPELEKLGTTVFSIRYDRNPQNISSKVYRKSVESLCLLLSPFVPHITLALIKYPQKYTPNISPYLQSSYDQIALPVNRVQFFSSELLPDGAVHTLLGTFPLGKIF